MTFLNPFVLFGLIAAGIPLLLHLLSLRKLSTVEFSSLLFLKELQKTRTVKRIRLRQWLLLLLRTLLIAAVVLAFSRPALKGPIAGLGGEKAQTAMTIIVDDSPSMGVRSPHGVVFSRAKEEVGSLLSLAGENVHVRLAPLSSMGDPHPYLPVISPADARDLLGRMELSQVTAPFPKALATAAALVVSAPDANRELYLVTDNQATQWRTASDDSIAFSDPGSSVYIVGVPTDGIDNAGITDVTATSHIVAPNTPIALRAAITRSGPGPAHAASVSVYLDATRVAQRLVDVPAEGTVSADFEITPKRAGILHGTVRLEDDALDGDNTRTFVLDVPGHVRVLLVGQNAADTRYVSAALTLAGDSTALRLFSVQRITEKQLPSVDLSTFDALVLCNVAPVSDLEGMRCANFARAGGALVTFPGPGTDVAAWNHNLLARLGIPPVRNDTTTARGTTAGQGFLSIVRADIDHPVFSGLFETKTRRDVLPFATPHINRTVGVSPGRSGARIMDLSDGTPFLTEYNIDAGRVLVFSVDAGTAWSDFPLQPMYAPLLHRAVMYLTSRSQGNSDAVVGAPLHFTLRQRDLGGAGMRFSVRAPSGLEQHVSPHLSSSTGTTDIVSEPTREAGAFDLIARNAGERESEPAVVRSAAVSIAPGESDLRPANDKDLQSAWQATGLDHAKVRFVGAGTSVAAAVVESRVGIELWKLFAVLAVILAVTEMAVGRVARTDTNAGAAS